MMKPQRLILGLIALIGGALSLPAQFVWNGLGPIRTITIGTNWRGGVAPLNNGLADFYLHDAINKRLILASNFSLHAINLDFNDQYYFDAVSPGTVLTLTGGILPLDSSFNQLWFTSNITLNLSGAQTLDVRGGQINVAGQITGSSPVTLLSSDNVNGGFFIFNNTGAGNTYTGGTILGDGTNLVGVAFWNSSPFGTGNVTVLSGATNFVQLIAHGTQTVANNFTFNGPGSILLRSWDDRLLFSGAITLASNTILQPQFSQRALAAPNQAGSIPIPGMSSRNPIVFSGNIGETGGARTLTVGGVGIVYLTGTSTYTGGTTVNGALVYGSAASAPGTGAILVNGQGYLGFADVTAGQFASFLAAHVNTAGSIGAIGIDTLPGASTVTFNDNINLSTYNAALRIGTSSSAIISVSSTITPQGANYQFGNGGGTLFVAANLTLPKGLILSSTNITIPLTLYLQGYNVYTGATLVQNGFLILDGASAISPSTPSFTAAGLSTNVGTSYIGYTDVAGTTTAAFLAKFTPNIANTWGILGFDTHQGNSTVTIGAINLTGFNDGVFIGTTTSAILNGAITPSTVTNGNNSANTVRLTASQNGVLTVNSTFSGSTALMIGTPVSAGAFSPYSSGTVIMNGANSYTGGTTLNASNVAGITLALGNNAALGTGALTVSSGNSGIAGLAGNTVGINLPNAINLVNTGTAGPQLYFTGLNAFTVSGNISGDATSGLNLFNAVPLTVSLAGNNSLFLGDISIGSGILNFLNNTAAGLGTIYYSPSANATVSFGGAATAPVVHGIFGDSGSLVVSGGTILTFDISDDVTHKSEYGGVVSGAGSLIISAPLSPSNNDLYLYGNNTYSGGTQIVNKGVLALGSNTAAGTGTVNLAATTGGLILNSGVTFTNPLIFTSGLLGGFGTFAPSGSPTITFGTGQTVAPGVSDFNQDGRAGSLTFNTNVTFANGGAYNWGLEDVARADGISFLNISGNLVISATTGGFQFKIATFDSNHNLGLAALTYGTPYSLPVLTASGTITGFSPTAFTIDATQFQGGTMSPTVFSLSQTGNTIYLNFTPVPEPSTYALLGLGLSVVLVPVLRRRRA